LGGALVVGHAGAVAGLVIFVAYLGLGLYEVGRQFVRQAFFVFEPAQAQAWVCFVPALVFAVLKALAFSFSCSPLGAGAGFAAVACVAASISSAITAVIISSVTAAIASAVSSAISASAGFGQHLDKKGPVVFGICHGYCVFQAACVFSAFAAAFAFVRPVPFVTLFAFLFGLVVIYVL